MGTSFNASKGIVSVSLGDDFVLELKCEGCNYIFPKKLKVIDHGECSSCGCCYGEYNGGFDVIEDNGNVRVKIDLECGNCGDESFPVEFAPKKSNIEKLLSLLK